MSGSHNSNCLCVLSHMHNTSNTSHASNTSISTDIQCIPCIQYINKSRIQYINKSHINKPHIPYYIPQSISQPRAPCATRLLANLCTPENPSARIRPPSQSRHRTRHTCRHVPRHIMLNTWISLSNECSRSTRSITVRSLCPRPDASQSPQPSTHPRIHPFDRTVAYIPT